MLVLAAGCPKNMFFGALIFIPTHWLAVLDTLSLHFMIYLYLQKYISSYHAFVVFTSFHLIQSLYLLYQCGDSSLRENP